MSLLDLEHRVRYGYDALFPEFRRCQWKSVEGKPIMREPRLPDDETDMDMGAFYKTCIDSGLKDMEIVSKIRLYGASTNSTADTGVDVLQNYKIDADGLNHIQADRDAKLQLTRPRLGETCSHPNGRADRPDAPTVSAARCLLHPLPRRLGQLHHGHEGQRRTQARNGSIS